MSRPSLHRYLMDIAHAASRRSTCDRKHVGAVVAQRGCVVATGYNGSLPGLPHCDEVGHDLVALADGSVNCVRTTHAEVNAVAQAAAHGVALQGTTLYTNTFPCWACAKTVLSAGVVRVIYDAPYRKDDRVIDACRALQVELVDFATL